MAKLNKNLAKQATDKAEDWKDGFQPVEPGLYLAKLTKVDTDGMGPAGPYWTWEYESLEVGEQPGGRKFWDNTSLSDKAIGRLGKVFEAFGVPATTDTDDLIGNVVCLDITIDTIRKGDRTGEQTNRVRSVLAGEQHPQWEEHESGVAAATGASSPDDFG